MRRAERERLEAVDAACRQHSPHVPLAEKITEQVNAFKIGREAVDNPSGLMELLTADLMRQELVALVRRKFDSLPAETRAAVLASTFEGDDVLQSRLIEERARVRARGQISGNIAELKQDADLYQRISLGRVAQGAIVEVQLYDRDDYVESDSLAALLEGYDRQRYMRAASMGDGRLHLLDDIVESEAYGNGSPYFEDHEIIELGTARGNKRDQRIDFVPDIYAGTLIHAVAGTEHYPLVLYDEAHEETTFLVAGQVSVNGEIIF